MPRKNRSKPLPWEADVYEAIVEWTDILAEMFEDVDGKIDDEKVIETIMGKLDSLEEAIWRERGEREVAPSPSTPPGSHPVS
jgi:hypothetical protein